MKARREYLRCVQVSVRTRRLSLSLTCVFLVIIMLFYNYETTKKTDEMSTDYLENCTEWFEDTLEDNLKVISKYPRGNAELYFEHIHGNLLKPNTIMTSFPVILSASDEKFYGVLQGLLKTIHELLLPKYKDIKVIVYDMGFTEEQLDNMKTFCRCEVRKFPFHLFPPHVQEKLFYAWKPLMVKTVLMEFGWVWYMDSSTRITADNVDEALRYSKKNSILFFSNPQYLNVAFQTDIGTMKYLGENTCKFRHFGEIEAGFGLYHFDRISNITVSQWAACALNKDCIAPKGSENKLICDMKKKIDGRCHRYDQSVLSIILRRLFHERNDYPLVPINIRKFNRGEHVNYFKAQTNS